MLPCPPRRMLSLLLLLALALPVHGETLSICYHYGCKQRGEAVLDALDNHQLGSLLAQPDPEHERQALAQAIGLMNQMAARTTPIGHDRGGNVNDNGPGSQDCIDHSTNTTTYLHYLLAHGWLHFHRVLEPVWRAPWLVDLHYSAAIEDLSDGLRYAVDSWFFDHGLPAVVLPLADWNKGWSP